MSKPLKKNFGKYWKLGRKIEKENENRFKKIAPSKLFSRDRFFFIPKKSAVIKIN